MSNSKVEATFHGPKDYMLTVWSSGYGARDVQVNGAPNMETAIRLAERETGCRVDHGRSGVGSEFDPAIIIDAATGVARHVHERTADASMQIVNPFVEPVSVRKGEGRR